MPKEDYLLRYLEKLSRVLAAMLGMRDRGFPEDGLRLADETFKEMLDLNIDELVKMPVEIFIELIGKRAYNNSYLEIITQLTHETAKSFMAHGQDDSANQFYAKSLKLYYLLNEKDKTFSFEREQIIGELEEITRTK